jgi:protein-S-isoprenylcysteine O-methyltransferase Ste14
VARLLGLPLVGGGIALAAWFARTMRSADTTMYINKPVSRVVQDGPFHFSRNPGYLSLTMLYAGIAVLRNALWAVVLLPVVVYVIEREERYLERTFGEEYLNYKARVRRYAGPNRKALTRPRDERLDATDVAKAGNASVRSTRRAG